MWIVCDTADGDNEGPYLMFEEQEPREKDQKASRATERSLKCLLSVCRSSALSKIICHRSPPPFFFMGICLFLNAALAVWSKLVLVGDAWHVEGRPARQNSKASKRIQCYTYALAADFWLYLNFKFRDGGEKKRWLTNKSAICFKCCVAALRFCFWMLPQTHESDVLMDCMRTLPPHWKGQGRPIEQMCVNEKMLIIFLSPLRPRRLCWHFLICKYCSFTEKIPTIVSTLQSIGHILQIKTRESERKTSARCLSEVQNMPQCCLSQFNNACFLEPLQSVR